jgi:DNA-binding response OmpR family regulator
MNLGPATRVLIVDDSPDIRELLEIMLNWDGFVTLTASSGEEALASAAEQLPDLILLDFVLPDLSGCEVAARMKGDLRTKDIPIMIISGMSDSASRRRALSAGADDFITKPIDRSELCQRVRNVLRLKTAAEGFAEAKVAAGRAGTIDDEGEPQGPLRARHG